MKRTHGLNGDVGFKAFQQAKVEAQRTPWLSRSKAVFLNFLGFDVWGGSLTFEGVGWKRYPNQSLTEVSAGIWNPKRGSPKGDPSRSNVISKHE